METKNKFYKLTILIIGLFLWNSTIGFAQSVPEIIQPFATPSTIGTINPLSDLRANIHFTYPVDDQKLDYIQMAGFTGVRMDLNWQGTETTPHIYDFAGMDSLLSHLEARGLSLLAILDYGSTLYPDCSPPSTGSAYMHFADFAQAAAQHFRGHGVSYEIYNEENGYWFWNPVNASNYTALVLATAPRIHQADSSADVISGGLDRGASNWSSFLDTFLLDGGGAVVNSIGFHPYYTDQEPEIALTSDIDNARNIIKSYLPTNTPPLRSTEWGFTSEAYGLGNSSVGREVQAKFAVRSVLDLWALNMPSQVWYDISDDCADSTNYECNFGLIDFNDVEKQSGTYMRTLINAVKGKTYQGVLTTTTLGLHALKFDSLVNTMLALWLSDAAEGIYPYPSASRSVSFMEQPLSIVNSMGVSQTIPLLANGVYTIDVGEDPIYVTFGILTGIPPLRDSTNTNILVYPNPFNESFNVLVTNGTTEIKDARMKIYNICGKEVKDVSINSDETTVGRDNLQSGFYFYSIISNNNNIANGKLIVQ